MIELFFGDVFSILTTVFVIVVLVFIFMTLRRRTEINTWGRRILFLVIAGTAISGLSAMRDGYAAPGALFSMEGIHSALCSLAGGAVFLIGFASLVVRKQTFRKIAFYMISSLFLFQVLLIEISRIILFLK